MSITPVTDGRQFEEFIRLPFRLYATDANWVPPLLSSERKMIDPKRNPFYDHAEAVHFLAWKDGRIAGRISAIVNRLHNEFHQEKSGFWGYFECEDDPALACELFDAAAAWLREKGMTRMVGPASPSLNDPCGLLVDGFKWSPFVLMPYNPPFYIKLVVQSGFTKAMDLWAYILVENDLVKERIDRVANAVKNRGDIVIRPMNLDRFEEELAIIKEVYNDAWEKNWGFVPLTDAEIRFAAREMKAILLPGLATIAELKGRPIGFALALPDINHILKRCKGSLLPFGWFHFLKFRLRKIPTFRLIALGVRREFHHHGIGTLFYQRYIDEGLRLGYRAAELSWVLETNDLMNRPIQQMGGKPYKTYRMYERPI